MFAPGNGWKIHQVYCLVGAFCVVWLNAEELVVEGFLPQVWVDLRGR
jgi:hypothetical protein